MPTNEDERAMWLSEAQAIVNEWEQSGMLRLLSTTESAVLTDRIARALQHAFELGRKRSA